MIVLSLREPYSRVTRDSRALNDTLHRSCHDEVHLPRHPLLPRRWCRQTHHLRFVHLWRYCCHRVINVARKCCSFWVYKCSSPYRIDQDRIDRDPHDDDDAEIVCINFRRQSCLHSSWYSPFWMRDEQRKDEHCCCG